MRRKQKHVTNEGILNIVLEISRKIPHELTHISDLVEVLNKVFTELKGILKFQKGYVVEFSIDTKKYHPLNDCFFGEWSERSQELFSVFFREQNEWRDVDRGSLYMKLLSREDPLAPQVIRNWKNSKNKERKFWIHKDLRKDEADIKSAIVTPFIGSEGRHYLTMIALTEPPDEKKIEIHNLILSRVISELVSRSSKMLSKSTPEYFMREKAKILMDASNVGYDNLHHAQRVRKICERLAELLVLDERDVFQVQIAALLHDYGKTGLEKDTVKIAKIEFDSFLRKSNLSKNMRRKLEDIFEDLQEKNEFLLRKHTEMGATMLYREFENYGTEAIEWIFIILTHHHFEDYYKKEILRDRDLKRFLSEQGMEVKKTKDIYMKNILYYLEDKKPNILKMLDILVLADSFDDKCGWKFHRPEKKQNPEGAMISILSDCERILRTPEVKDIIDVAKQSIYDVYDEPRLI